MSSTVIAIAFASGAQASAVSLMDPNYLADGLKRAGYKVDTAEDVLPAVGDSRPWIRRAAIDYLGVKFGKAGVEGLKRGLDDRWLSVRIDAARALGKLGETAGRDRMIRDWNELMDAGALAGPGARLESWRVGDALKIGCVLAELGDARAIGLAHPTALNDALAANRIDAMFVLMEGIKLAERGQLVSGIQPVESMKQVAISEREEGMQRAICGLAVNSGIRDENAMAIINAVKASPHLTDKARSFADFVIENRRRHNATSQPASRPAEPS